MTFLANGHHTARLELCHRLLATPQQDDVKPDPKIAAAATALAPDIAAPAVEAQWSRSPSGSADIAPPSAMERRITTLRNAGVEVEYRKYEGVGHGFGVGSNTSAEGWVADAVHFWRKFIVQTSNNNDREVRGDANATPFP